MKIFEIILLFVFVTFMYSCSDKSITKQENSEKAINENYSQEIFLEYFEKVDMIYSIEYYKEEIFKDQANHRSATIEELENNILSISSMVIIDNIIPNFLTFLVTWSDIRGYIYYLYTFDNNQKIFNRHFLNFLRLPRNHREKLMEKIPGQIIENELISIGDFNNDGINEILSYSWHQNIGYVFSVYGFCFVECNIVEFCKVPVHINFDNPFPSVEYIGNGFRILEIIDEDSYDLAWNNYLWNNNMRKYIKE
jgi:penicillin-binding protein-related factor A (putative recombinase)